jgi:hypothetical protein
VPAAAPAARPPAARPPAARTVKPARRDLFAEGRAWLASVWNAINARPEREKAIAGWSALAVVVVAVVAAGLMLAPRSVPLTGTAIIDAVPWANVTGIEAEDGTRPALPSAASTPLSIALPAGTYRVRLVGPPPEAESRLITVQVQANGMTSTPVERFRMLTPEEYFEPYLASVPAALLPAEEPASPAESAPAQTATPGAAQ